MIPYTVTGYLGENKLLAINTKLFLLVLNESGILQVELDHWNLQTHTTLFLGYTNRRAVPLQTLNTCQ